MGKHVDRDTKKCIKEARKVKKQQEIEERESLVIPDQAKKGVHNCPCKDAGTTHPFRARCLKLQHGGYCPVCGGIYSWQSGCREHGYSRDELLGKSPGEEEKKSFRLVNGFETASDEVAVEDNHEEHTDDNHHDSEPNKRKKTKERKKTLTRRKK